MLDGCQLLLGIVYHYPLNTYLPPNRALCRRQFILENLRYTHISPDLFANQILQLAVVKKGNCNITITTTIGDVGATFLYFNTTLELMFVNFFK